MTDKDKLIAELKAENDTLKSQLDFEVQKKEVFETENERLKSCLQEIKEIAKIGMHCEGMGCDFMPKILDLITKAEEE